MLGLVFGFELGDPFVYHYQGEFYESYSLGQILVCTYTIWLYDQILISYIIPCGLSLHPVVPSLVLLLHQYDAFSYYVINRFISVST